MHYVGQIVCLDQIYADLSLIKMSSIPVSYIFPSALRKYEEIFDTRVEGKGKLRQIDREKSLQALMTVNLLNVLKVLSMHLGWRWTF